MTCSWSPLRFKISQFQSTLPQGKWPKKTDGLLPPATISIHTSTREVTPLSMEQTALDAISIHTSTREVTKSCEWFRKSFKISIHTSTREVTPQYKAFADNYIISIHTSTREVTKIIFKWCARSQISIHTSTREVTYIFFMLISLVLFQSTLPQGKWLFLRIFIRCHCLDFNPHFHKGSDCAFVPIHPHFVISIHTSTREVTGKQILSVWGKKFQSTLPQGKWLSASFSSMPSATFQSTLPQGKWHEAVREE